MQNGENLKEHQKNRLQIGLIFPYTNEKGVKKNDLVLIQRSDNELAPQRPVCPPTVEVGQVSE